MNLTAAGFVSVPLQADRDPFSLTEAREMIQASVTEQGKIDLRHHIDVRDESGAFVYVLPLEEAVTVMRGKHAISGSSVAA